MNLDELRFDCSIKSKKGLHFILASIMIWIMVGVVHGSTLPILTKNLLTFCCTAPLMPLAFLISKPLKIDFQNKGNPLTNLGVLFALNQMLYLVIAMWVYPTVPDKLVMVIAMIFGAHLLPFGWLYQSKAYYGFSVVITLFALVVGVNFSPFVLAVVMAGMEILFSLSLILEIKTLNRVIS